MMPESVQLALIVAGTTALTSAITILVAPMVANLQQAKRATAEKLAEREAREAEKKADRDREDEVRKADQARQDLIADRLLARQEQIAHDLTEQQHTLARKTEQAAELLLQSNADIATKAQEAAAALIASNEEVAKKAHEAAQSLIASNAEVAQKAQEAAASLITSNEEVARKAKEASDLAEQSAIALTEKITKIGTTTDITHTLVNSQKTASMEEILAGTKRELILLDLVVRKERDNNIEPSPEYLGEIETAKRRIHELEIGLAERAEQLKKSQIETAAAKAPAAATLDPGTVTGNVTVQAPAVVTVKP